MTAISVKEHTGPLDFSPVFGAAPGVKSDELGDLRLTAEEEAVIVALMKTLSDGWTQPEK